VAITRAVNLYDFSRAQTTFHEWKSDKQKLRLFSQEYGATVNAVAAIDGRQAAFQNGLPSATASLHQFRAFDAQAPPPAC
jgi:hypothetical protein